MYNWRARIGYITPGQSIETTPRDFWKLAPPGVSLVLSFAGMREIDIKEVEGAISRLQRAAEELNAHNVDLVQIGGVPMVTYKGPESEKPLLDQVRAWVPGKIVTTDFSSQMNGLRALGAKKIALVSPNIVETTRTYERSAEALGFTVLHTECHDSLRCNIPLISQREIYHSCARALRAAPGADALWIPCGNFDVLDLIQVVEDDFGVPVVAANQAMCWWNFLLLNVNTDGISGYGRLFRTKGDLVAPFVKEATGST